MCDDRVDLTHHVFAVHKNRPIRAVPQGNVQDGPILGRVDFLAREHLFGPVLDLGLPGQIEEQPHRFFRDAVLGVVEQDVLEAERKLVEPLGVVAEQIAHLQRSDLLIMGVEGLPGVELSRMVMLNSPRRLGLCSFE